MTRNSKKNHQPSDVHQGRGDHDGYRKTAVLPAVFLMAAACASPEPTTDSFTPIVGGVDANIMDFPWQVSLQSPVSSDDEKPFHFCGGSIIDKFWILTAAHCVDGLQEDQLRVVAGSTKVSESDREGQVRNVLRIVSHSEYTEASKGNDIALIRLSEPLDLGAAIGAMPIPLLTASDASLLAGSGVLARVSGWGTLASGGDAPDHLQSVELPIIENATAEQMVRREPEYSDWRITPDQLAAGYAHGGGKDACQGDSGGPLVVPDEEGTGFFLAGVVSWGIGCAEPGIPGFYARVTSFTEWIEKTTEAPVVALRSPRGETDLKGQITLSAKAASESGTINRVEFILPNGESFVDDSAPYEMQWDTTKVPDGFAVFEARVFDDQEVLGPEDFVEALILNGETCHHEVAASNTPTSIPNDGVRELVSTIEVAHADQIVGAELSLEIRHEDTLELAMWLVSPSGNYHVISTRDQTDDTRISIVNQPIEGTRGERVSGTWELHVVDYFAKSSVFPTNAGTLESWSVTFESTCHDPKPEIPGHPELGSLDRCVGRSEPGASGWKDYKGKGLYLEVDTSDCGYKVTPQYITSMGGAGWHWATEGSTAIYFPTPTGFSIYLVTSLTAKEAEARKWHINWEALPSDAPDFDQCHGRTTPGETAWEQYGSSGITTVIDTSKCGMDEVPLYFASLGGLAGHWRAKGETAIYEQTDTSFRIYLYSPGMTPQKANGLGWHINWSAAPDELNSPSLCTGHTEKEDWRPYGKSAYYVNVDTSRCGFTATPDYFTSLQGRTHWMAQGGTAIYFPTETGFRIYVKGADARRTQVLWKASQR